MAVEDLRHELNIPFGSQYNDDIFRKQLLDYYNNKGFKYGTLDGLKADNQHDRYRLGKTMMGRYYGLFPIIGVGSGTMFNSQKK